MPPYDGRQPFGGPLHIDNDCAFADEVGGRLDTTADGEAAGAIGARTVTATADTGDIAEACTTPASDALISSGARACVVRGNGFPDLLLACAPSFL